MDTYIVSRPLSRIALGGFVLALVAGLMFFFAGGGYRLGWWISPWPDDLSLGGVWRACSSGPVSSW